MLGANTLHLPYLRLAAFYLFFFASLGALAPYLSLYFKHLGFGATHIAQLVAIFLATKIIAPNIWGWIADHTGRRMQIIRLATLLALIAFSGMTLGSSFWWLAGVMVLFSFFWNAALPQFEATTMTMLADNPHHYSRIRVWGSIGFIASVIGLAPVLQFFGISLLPYTVIMLLAAIWIVTLVVPESSPQPPHSAQISLTATLRRPVVLATLAACFWMQASHGPYYAFFSIYVQEHGYALDMVGKLWALGVLAEVLVFLYMHRWLPKFGARRLLLFSFLITALRWFLIANFADQLLWLLLAQIMHAASFGVYHAAAIDLIHRLFPGRLQGRGQALYSSLSFGLGGAIGSLLSGYVWSGLQPSATFLMGSTFALLSFVITLVWISDSDIHR